MFQCARQGVLGSLLVQQKQQSTRSLHQTSTGYVTGTNTQYLVRLWQQKQTSEYTQQKRDAAIRAFATPPTSIRAPGK